MRIQHIQQQLECVFGDKLSWIDQPLLSQAASSLRGAWNWIDVAIADDLVFSEFVKDSIVSERRDTSSKPLLDWLTERSVDPYHISSIFMILGCLRYMRGWARYSMSGWSGSGHQIQLCRTALNKLNKLLDVIWR